MCVAAVQCNMVKNYHIKSDRWITNLDTAKTFRDFWLRQEPKERESWIYVYVYLSVQHFVDFSLSDLCIEGFKEFHRVQEDFKGHFMERDFEEGDFKRAKEWLNRWLLERIQKGA